MTTRVALIGAGNMGGAFGHNLLKGGVELTVYDPNPAGTERLAAEGARVADGLTEVVKGAELVLTSLPSPTVVEDVYLGPQGLLAVADTSAILMDMSTNDPFVARRIGRMAQEAGFRFLDTPVLRDSSAAWRAESILLVGGSSDLLEEIRPILAHFTADAVHVGDVGDSQVIKIINNSVSQGNMNVLMEAYAVAYLQGVDVGVLRNVIERGLGQSAALQWLSPMLEANDHRMRFSVDMGLKDTRLFLQLAQKAGFRAFGAEGAAAHLQVASASGHGGDDLSMTLPSMQRFATGRGAT